MKFQGSMSKIEKIGVDFQGVNEMKKKKKISGNSGGHLKINWKSRGFEKKDILNMRYNFFWKSPILKRH